MINSQNLSYKIFLNKIPISKQLNTVINNNELSKIDYLSKGDDYQVLFTAAKSKSKIIKKISLILGLRITKIGNIQKKTGKSILVDSNNLEIKVKNKGYFHQF